MKASSRPRSRSTVAVISRSCAAAGSAGSLKATSILRAKTSGTVRLLWARPPAALLQPGAPAAGSAASGRLDGERSGAARDGAVHDPPARQALQVEPRRIAAEVGELHAAALPLEQQPLEGAEV